jgi:HK97 family phage major capsid protein
MTEHAVEIARLAQTFGASDHAMDSIAAGESLTQFRNRLILRGAVRPTMLGMSRGELQKYSLLRAIEAGESLIGGNKPVASLEFELHEELNRRFGVASAGVAIRIPTDFLAHFATRDLTVASAGAGGYLVDTSTLGPVGLALPRSILGALGVQALEGLVGNAVIPVMKSAGNQTDLTSEASTATEVTPTFGQNALSPKGEAVYVEMSRQLIKQTSPGVQRWITDQILNAFAARLEFLALQGSGSGGQPTGLVNASGVNTQLGTSLALSGVLSMQSATGDRLGPRGGYVAPVAIASLLAQRQRASGTSTFLWEGNLYQGTLGGYPALSTSNMPSAKMLFGNWEMALFASWGTLALEINPYANFQAGLVGARIIHDVDVVALDPAAFTLASSIT